MSVGEIAGLVVLVAALAGFVEYGVEWIFGGWVHDKPMKLIGLIGGMTVALGCKLGIIGPLAASVGLTLGINAWVDYVITGAIMGMGSSYLHQFLKEWIPGKEDIEDTR